MFLQKTLAHPAYHRSYDYRIEPSQEERIQAWPWIVTFHCRGNCIPKQPRKFFCRDLSSQHRAPCSYRGYALINVLLFAGPTQTVDTFDVHITRIKSLTRFHRCSDGLSSNKAFTRMEKISNFYFVQMINGDLTSDIKVRVDVQVKNNQFCYISHNYRLGSLFRLFRDHNSCCCAVWRP